MGGGPDGAGVTLLLYPPRMEELEEERARVWLIEDTDWALGDEDKWPLGVIDR